LSKNDQISLGASEQWVCAKVRVSTSHRVYQLGFCKKEFTPKCLFFIAEIIWPRYFDN